MVSMGALSHRLHLIYQFLLLIFKEENSCLVKDLNHWFLILLRLMKVHISLLLTFLNLINIPCLPLKEKHSVIPTIIAKEAFNRKISFLKSKLNIKLRKKLVTCYVWRIALYGSETWTLRKLERRYLKSFEMWCWRRMEKIKWSEKVINEQVLDRIGEKRTILNNILRWKAN